MKFNRKNLFILIIFILTPTILVGTIISFNGNQVTGLTDLNEIQNNLFTSNYDQFSKGNFTGYEFSYYNLSVYLDEDTSKVAGNLTVNYYNADPVNFSQIPFHIYPSGMRYDTRPGYMEILNVTTTEDPKEELDFDFYNSTQLMWVNLTTELEPGNRTSFIISFNTTLPDGGIDRANEHGWDHNQTRIFKFSHCYPQPCVYDEFDGWNIDPYITTFGDPFYFDMAYYDLVINVPENMTVAATGALIENFTIGDRTIHHFNPRLPVREVTFSASRYFIVESVEVKADPTNVTVSTYFLPKSYWLWHDYAMDCISAGGLFNLTFGDYPYPSLNVVQEYTHYGGMEYPCQVYASEAADYASNPWVYLETVIVHEVGHQWFYNLVGVDEVDWGFLDEGIVCWITDWAKDYFHPSWHLFEPYWLMDYVWYYSMDVGLPNRINQSVYDCIATGTNYWYTAYRKAPVVFENLRRIIGTEKLLEGLTIFTHEYYFEIATFDDFIQSIETAIGASLDWFFFPWFDNPYLPKYNFTSVVYDTQSKLINITIEDVNEHLNPYSYSQPIPIEIYSSSTTLEFSSSEWVNGTTSLIIPIETIPNRVVLNYSENIPVQLSEYGITYLETTDITIIFSPVQQIPGYHISIIILTVCASGLIIIAKKKLKVVPSK
ncbi:MAG: M1 family metallopeptidase [Candidatus Hodarchaeota archaeon]